MSGAMQKQDTAAIFTDSARAVYSQALLDLIEAGKPIVSVEADVMKAAGTAPVQERYPDRIVQLGVAEQNAVGVAAGLAEMGWIPFVNVFAVLLGRRAFDQVWMAVAFNEMNVKLHGLYSGFTTATNGPTHQSLEDIAVMRTLPNMVILEPADCNGLREAVFAAANHAGPVYIRNVRGDLPPCVGGDDQPYKIGKAALLRQGDDVSLIASGVMVQIVRQAAEELAKDGIEARVINIRTIKPLDEETVLQAAKETGAIVTVEDHGITGGLGSAVSEFLGETWPTPVKRIGVRDRFGDAGSFEWLIQAYEMDVPHIVAAAKEAMISRDRHQQVGP